MPSHAAPAGIRARGLTKHFGRRTVLGAVDLDVPAGTVHALLGPNGAGKTTTVRVLTTLLRPDSGQATVGGYDVRTEPADVRRSIGLSGQYAAVDEYLNGRENLHLLGRLHGLSRRAAAGRGRELLERFRLTEAADDRSATYSGGMRRRLDLACALVAHPSVVVLDEPTTGLDPRSRNDTWDVVRELLRDGAAVLLTTQYLEEADQLADLITVIDRGAIVATGTAAELKAHVNAERIEIAVAEHADLPAAAAVLARVGRGEPAVDERTGRVGVDVDSAAEALKTVLRDTDAAGIELRDVDIRHGTLDDVFLSLTGHAPPAGEHLPAQHRVADTRGEGALR